MEALPVHYITVDADSRGLARLEKIVEVLKPLSSRVCANLDELNGTEFSGDDCTLIRLSGRACTHALTWLSSTGRVATEVAIIGFADAILIEPGQPPRAVGVLPQAMISAIAAVKVRYDLSAAAFIIGANDETKVMAASLSRLGFKRLKIVDSDDRKTEQVVSALRRRLFGIEIEAVPRRTLTQVPNDSAFAVSVIESSDKSMLEDISYLNFLKKKGIWIDWNSATIDLGIENEIIDAGAMIFDAGIIRAWREAILLGSFDNLLSGTGQKPETVASALIEAWKISVQPSDTDPS